MLEEAKSLASSFDRFLKLMATIKNEKLYDLLGYKTFDKFTLNEFSVSRMTALTWVNQGNALLALPAATGDEGAGSTVSRALQNGLEIDRPSRASISGREANRLARRKKPPIVVDFVEVPVTEPEVISPDPVPASPAPKATPPPAAPTDRIDPIRELVDDLQSVTTADLRAYNGPWRVVLETEVRRAAEALGIVRRPSTTPYYGDGGGTSTRRAAARALQTTRTDKPTTSTLTGKLTRPDVTPMFKK